MKTLAFGLLLCSTMLTGCPSAPNDRSPSAANSSVIQLHGADAERARHRSLPGGICVDVMPDNTLVFADGPTDLVQLRKQFESFVSGGGHVITLRVLDGSSAKLAADVQAAAVDAGVPTIELVKYARS